MATPEQPSAATAGSTPAPKGEHTQAAVCRHPTVSIVIPTRNRPEYLEVALASIAPQARVAGAEVLVVDDAGPSAAARAQAERHGARYEPHERSLGLNVARNTGVRRSRGELVVFLDDDIAARPGWLDALLQAARAHPETDVFAGAIHARLEGRPPHTCGRERPPITTLELGPLDIDTRYAWGSNMAIRRSALQRIGPFEEALEHGGDEQEWQDRLRAREPSARVRYVARAAVEHRRAGDDARLRALARAQYTRGRAARRFDEWRGAAPSLGRELTTLGGCGWHVLRRACPAGLTMVAHSVGRVREALPPRSTPAPSPAVHRPHAAPRAGAAPKGAASADAASGTHTAAGTHTASSAQASAGAPAPADDFLSGHSGTVGGLRGRVRTLGDETIDMLEIAGVRRRLNAAARKAPRRRVLALSVVRPEHTAGAQRIRAELDRSRHALELYTRPPGGLGKFENLNRLLADHPATGYDWLLLIDDDVELPRGGIDRLLLCSERYDLQLAQPAHRLDSHAAWQVTRRHMGSVVRETNFVEIGPVTALAAATFAQLLPFPEVRMGWGLDAHWAALAREHGWRCGVVDAVAIGHRVAPAGDSYSRERAVAEARELLTDRPYVPASELERTLVVHRGWSAR
jgi:GT2 family glycosyltransferase